MGREKSTGSRDLVAVRQEGRVMLELIFEKNKKINSVMGREQSTGSRDLVAVRQERRVMLELIFEKNKKIQFGWGVRNGQRSAVSQMVGIPELNLGIKQKNSIRIWGDVKVRRDWGEACIEYVFARAHDT
jgi:hypothetical protein